MTSPCPRSPRRPRVGALLSTALWLTAASVLSVLSVPLAAGPAGADPRSDLLFHRGVASIGTGDYATARSAFETYLERNPGDPRALYFLGLVQRHEGELEAAVASFQAAIESDPDNAEAHVALVETLLDERRNQEANEAARKALDYAPEDAQLRLYAGIAAYRVDDPSAAIDHLQRAEQLDPALAREARYYIGLSQAVLGNLYASSGAFGNVVDLAPGHPLGISAQRLQQQMQPQVPDRIWYLSATAGLELDTNPTVASELLDPQPDGAGTFRLRGVVDAYRGHGLTLRAGYEGYLGIYIENPLVDQQTHVFKGLALYDYKDVRMSLRYDYAFTMLDLTTKFRGLNLLEPEVNFRLGRLGITQLFYQFLDYTYYTVPFENPLDRNGTQHSVGVNQIFTLPEPLNYGRLGVLYTDSNTVGSEFAFSGIEVNAGAGVLFPWHDIGFSFIYRYARLDYKNPSIFPTVPGTAPPAPGTGVRRDENVHNASLELSAPVWRQLSVALAATLTFASSQVPALNYDRQIVGTYLTWDF